MVFIRTSDNSKILIKRLLFKIAVKEQQCCIKESRSASATLIYFNTIWNCFFYLVFRNFNGRTKFALFEPPFQWIQAAVVEILGRITQIFKLFALLRSSQREVHWNSAHVASQQCFKSSRNSRCFSTSRFQKETIGGFSIQRVNTY